VATELTRLTEYDNGYEVRGPYASNTPRGRFEGKLPSDLKDYLNAQGDLSLLGRRFFRSRITEDMPYEQSMGILQKFRSLNQDPDSMVHGLLFQSVPEDVSGLSQEERQQRASQELEDAIELKERRGVLEQWLDEKGYDEGGVVYNKPLISSAAQATNIDPLLRMYNRSPASQGGLDSLINPPMTDPGGEADRQKMMEMQRSTFLSHLAGNPAVVGGGDTGGGDTGGEDVDPTEDIPFVDAVRNPDVEGGYEAPVDTFYPQVGSGYEQGHASGVPYSEIFGHSWDGFGGRDSRMPAGGGVNWGRLGSGIGAAGRWLAGKGMDIGEGMLRRHPLGALLPKESSSDSTIPMDIYGQRMDVDTITDPDYYPNLVYEGDPLEQAITKELVDDTLAVDTDALLESIDESAEVMPKEIRDAQAAAAQQQWLDRVNQTIHARKIDAQAGGYGLGGYRYGSRDDPSSGWGNRTPHLSSNRDEMFATGRIGISGRMLPSAGKGFGGENPFAPGYTPPQPGDARYAEHLIDTMGFDPQRMEQEINKAVEQDMPFWTTQDQQGNTVMVDKETGQVTVLDNAAQNQDINSGAPFIGGVASSGSGMNLGGLVSSHLMPLKY
tara:strand:- start:14515 stop:16338 length:1824 start_codon:yes stop_codon:yes gene_type:complete